VTSEIGGVTNATLKELREIGATVVTTPRNRSN